PSTPPLFPYTTLFRSRILPDGWVEYSRTPAPAATRGEYGALFQTNAGGDPRRLPSVPGDAFEMVGYEGQSVLIVPSRRAVIVRRSEEHTSELQSRENL